MLCILVGLAGCSAPKKNTQEPKKVKPVLDKPLTVNTEAGDATFRVEKSPFTLFGEAVAYAASPGGHIDTNSRRALYHIKWKEAQIVLAEEGIFSGTMEQVSGEMYAPRGPEKVVANTFKGDNAVATRENQTLIVTGNITMVSKDPGVTVKMGNESTVLKGREVTIECDRVEWQASSEIVKASGHVRVHGTYGEMTGLNEIWASPDFKQIATPGMFKKP